MSDYIPCESDLWMEILARLPAADALRCTSVCKSWYHLITSPFFIKLHLRLSISNPESIRVIVRFTSEIYEGDLYYLHRDNQTFDEIRELYPPRNTDISIHGSSNGIFCYSRDDGVRIYGERFILWNPSVESYLVLPKSRDRDRNGNLLQRHPHGCQRNVGFGFLRTTNDYKIVRVIYTERLNFTLLVPPQVEIYESSTGSWRDGDATRCSYVLNSDCYQALLNGRVHWTAFNPHRVGGTFVGLIVSFDLTSEEFETLMLPQLAQNKEPYFSVVCTLKESLCLLLDIEGWVSVFVMKEYGSSNSWEEVYNYNELPYTWLYIRGNGEILAKEQYAYEKYKLVSMNPKTDHVMDLGVHEDGQYFLFAYACIDSLCLLD